MALIGKPSEPSYSSGSASFLFNLLPGVFQDRYDSTTIGVQCQTFCARFALCKVAWRVLLNENQFHHKDAKGAKKSLW